MRIDFRRSGGYANLPLDYHVETEQMSSPEADELLRLVVQSAFFELDQAELPANPPGAADFFTYDIAISEGARTRSLSISEMAAPEALRTLLHYLGDLAIKAKLKDG